MASRTHWQEGDIAFLKPAMSFSPKDYNDLIGSGYVPQGATTHPVIILATKNHRAIVTTISAYKTEVNHLLPWQQRCHRAKNPDYFRAFEGSRRPDQRHPSLRLADPKMQMPKPQASWVFIRNFFCVPFSVLGHFNKAPVLLRVHPDSLAQLKADMQRFTRDHQDAGARLNAAADAAGSSAPPRRPRPHPPAAAPGAPQPRPRAQVEAPCNIAASPAPALSSSAPAVRAVASLAARTWSSVAAGQCTRVPLS